MKKLLLILAILFLAYSLPSCKKDKDVVISGPPAWFLYSNQMAFTGKVADSSVTWRFGVFEFQRGQGAINVEPSINLENI